MQTIKRIAISGKICSPEESRIAISAPHMSVYEFYGQGHTNYSFVSGIQSTKWILIGELFQRTSIIVDKLKKESRWAAQEGIAQWLEDRDRNPDLIPAKIAFAVEGWYTNGTAILPFKTGAFKPGLPVQIFVHEWDKNGFVPITTYGQNLSWFWTILIALAQPVSKVNGRVLPVYYPNEGKWDT